MTAKSCATGLLVAVSVALLAACTTPSAPGGTAGTSSALASTTTGSSAATAINPAEPLRLTLLALNDFHGQLSSLADGSGGAAWLAGTLDQLSSGRAIRSLR
jgi:2',3'-cyclic-nucleotide 2'-phosphodiesterase (5'-nucleotidase family)